MTLAQLSPLRLFVFCLLAMVLFAVPAYADVLNLTPNALSCTGGKPNTLSLLGNEKNAASGAQSVDAQMGGCQGKFFSRFICLFESTLGIVIATFFCHLQAAWMEPLAAMFMLFMAVMGILFVTGITRFTVKEISILLFKMGLIATFALNTDMALEVAFKFFLGLTKGTVELFGNITTSPPSLGEADTRLTSIGGPATNTGSCSFSGALGAGGFLLLFFAAIFLLPMIIWLFIAAAISLLSFFARAAFGYLFSLVMLTFMIATMPIFVSFALFKRTRRLFDGWIAQLFSNSLQIILVFGFLAFASNLSFDFVNDLARLLTNYTVSFAIPPFTWVTGDINLGSVCSICAPNVIDDPTYLPSIKVPMIAPSPNQCRSPEGISWFAILREERFLYYLAVQGAALFITGAVMSEFIKDIPDLAKTLGGGSASLVIGGISRNYSPHQPGNSLVAPGFTSATFNFERGFQNALAADKTFDLSDKSAAQRMLYRSTPMKIAAAIAAGGRGAMYGAGNVTRHEAQQLEKNKIAGKAQRAKKVITGKSEVRRNEISIDSLEKTLKDLREQREESLRKIEQLRAEAEAEKLSTVAKDPRLATLEYEVAETARTAAFHSHALTKLEGEAALLSHKVDAANTLKDPKEKVRALRELTEEKHRLDDRIEREKREKELQEHREFKLREELKEFAKQHGIVDSPAALDLRVQEKLLEQNDLFLNETDLKLSNARKAHEIAESTLKQANADATEWDRITSDPRYASSRHNLGLLNNPGQEIYGTSGGVMEDLWGTQADQKYFMSVKENRTKTWQSLMHISDD